MTGLLRNLINPPNPRMSQEELYNFQAMLYDVIDGLTAVSNTSQTLNADFSTLGTGGLTPITQADGDNAEFSWGWKVVGAAAATYTLTPTVYPDASLVNSASPYFIHTVVSTYSGTGLYFYQRQSDTVRKYQNQPITLTITANNNQSSKIKLRFNIVSYYGISATNTQNGGALYLEPGENQISATLTPPRLRDLSVDNTNYTEFQLYFENLNTGTADFDLYEIKAEFGKLSTALQGG